MQPAFCIPFANIQIFQGSIFDIFLYKEASNLWHFRLLNQDLFHKPSKFQVMPGEAKKLGECVIYHFKLFSVVHDVHARTEVFVLINILHYLASLPCTSFIISCLVACL